MIASSIFSLRLPLATFSSHHILNSSKDLNDFLGILARFFVLFFSFFFAFFFSFFALAFFILSPLLAYFLLDFREDSLLEEDNDGEELLGDEDSRDIDEEKEGDDPEASVRFEGDKLPSLGARSLLFLPSPDPFRFKSSVLDFLCCSSLGALSVDP